MVCGAGMGQHVCVPLSKDFALMCDTQELIEFFLALPRMYKRMWKNSEIIK